MWWSIEWKTWNEEIKDYETSSDTWNKWEDVVRVFMDCITDNLCGGATVTCYLGDMPYTDDPVVLEYCP